MRATVFGLVPVTVLRSVLPVVVLLVVLPTQAAFERRAWVLQVSATYLL